MALMPDNSLLQPFLVFFIFVWLRPSPKLDADRYLLQASSFENKKNDMDTKNCLTKEKTPDILNTVKLNYYVNQGKNNGD